jgi:hypothetical protein
MKGEESSSSSGTGVGGSPAFFPHPAEAGHGDDKGGGNMRGRPVNE